jgi:hypothetical protein
MMASGEDEVMAPVLNGMCRYESLLDGAVSLVDIVRMNDAYAVRSENQRRARAAQEQKR